VTLKYRVATQDQFAVIADLRLDIDHRLTNAAGIEPDELLTERHAARFRRAVNLDARYPNGAEKAHDPRRDGRSAGHCALGSAQADVILHGAEHKEIGQRKTQLLCRGALVAWRLGKRLAGFIGPFKQSSSRATRLHHPN